MGSMGLGGLSGIGLDQSHRQRRIFFKKNVCALNTACTLKKRWVYANKECMLNTAITVYIKITVK